MACLQAIQIFSNQSYAMFKIMRVELQKSHFIHVKTRIANNDNIKIVMK